MATQKIIGVPSETINLLNAGTITVDQVFNIKDFSVGDAVYFYVNSASGYIKSIVTDDSGTKKFGTPFLTGSQSSATEGETNMDGISIIGNGCIIDCATLPESVTGLGNMPQENVSYTIPQNSYVLIGNVKNERCDLNDTTKVEFSNVADGDYMLLTNMTQLIYHEDVNDNNKMKWCKQIKNMSTREITYDPSYAILEAGTGAWYKSSTSDVSITFKTSV